MCGSWPKSKSQSVFERYKPDELRAPCRQGRAGLGRLRCPAIATAHDPNATCTPAPATSINVGIPHAEVTTHHNDKAGRAATSSTERTLTPYQVCVIHAGMAEPFDGIDRRRPSDDEQGQPHGTGTHKTVTMQATRSDDRVESESHSGADLRLGAPERLAHSAAGPAHVPRLTSLRRWSVAAMVPL